MERDWNQYKLDLIRWIDKPNPRLNEHQLSDALYAYSETGILPNVSKEEAFHIWTLIERIREDGFPDDLQI